DLIGSLTIQVGDDEERWVRHEIGDQLKQIRDYRALGEALTAVEGAFASPGTWGARLHKAQVIVAAAAGSARDEDLTMERVVSARRDAVGEAESALLAD